METLDAAPDADLVFSCPPYGDLETYSDNPADLSNMEWRNNLYHYAGANEGKAASFGSRVITQKALVEAVADAGAVYGDPLFVDANQGDFRLKRSSPAIDRGCDVPWVTNDMKGTSRPQSARPDIGAFEFVDAPAPR